ncbi:hypothetical protein SpCBS45565_g07174 [Spizellomyces sp. 'palustris']|nr:hypothetical protein SpCBS45565_g07174 [Spizellomyces sp. 'palustris']
MARVLAWAILPFLAALVWTGIITALLILWLATGTPHYKQDEAPIVYISDVGAKYKTLFIVGTATTSALYVGTLLADFILRSLGYLPERRQRRETIDAVLSILFGFLAAACLTLLAIFDALNHSSLHWGLTLGFIFSLACSAGFKVAELRRLRKDHWGIRALWRSFRTKLVLVIFAIGLTIAMIVLMSICTSDPSRPEYCDSQHSAAAVCEWVAAYVTAAYFLSLVSDFRVGGHPRAAALEEVRVGPWGQRDSNVTLDTRGRQYY